MTTHQQDSSQPQQSQDSPHFGAGVGLMMVETVEAMEPGMLVVVMEAGLSGVSAVQGSAERRSAYLRKVFKM
jgi:hypothetical protein